MFSNAQLTGNDSSQLIKLPLSLTEYPSFTEQKLGLSEAVDALAELQASAVEDNLSFQVVSSYRSFDDQKSIWNNKFSGKRPIYDINENVVEIGNLTDLEIIHAIMLFSALPGASRHHWGTDFDIFPTAAIKEGYQPQLLQSEFAESGIAADLSQWLVDHLPNSSFFRPYEKFQNGIAFEPWHISYQPSAEIALSELTAINLAEVISQHDDVSGLETICENIDPLYERYISNICLGSHSG